MQLYLARFKGILLWCSNLKLLSLNENNKEHEFQEWNR